jgi:hypothetical protein
MLKLICGLDSAKRNGRVSSTGRPGTDILTNLQVGISSGNQALTRCAFVGTNPHLTLTSEYPVNHSFARPGPVSDAQSGALCCRASWRQKHKDSRYNQ